MEKRKRNTNYIMDEESFMAACNVVPSTVLYIIQLRKKGFGEKKILRELKTNSDDSVIVDIIRYVIKYNVKKRKFPVDEL